MKKMILFGVLMLAGSVFAEVILAGYDGCPLLSAGGGPPNYQPITGVGSYLSWNTGPLRKDYGSTDTTWGSFAGDTAAFVSASGNFNRGSIGMDETISLFISIENNTTGDMILSELHLDYKRTVWNALDKVGIFTSGDLTDTGFQGTIAFSGNFGTPDQSDWEDADFSLSSVLSDNVLAAGESAVIEIRGSTASDNRPNTAYFDNIAISGSVVPEPATVGMLAFTGGLILFIRRNFLR